MRILLAILLALSITSCLGGRKLPDLPTVGDHNPVTGQPYTSGQIQEIIEDQQEKQQDESLLDRLLSSKILLLYTAGAIILILAGVAAGYHGKMILAGCCGAGAIVMATMPVIITVLNNKPINHFFIGNPFTNKPTLYLFSRSPTKNLTYS